MTPLSGFNIAMTVFAAITLLTQLASGQTFQVTGKVYMQVESPFVAFVPSAEDMTKPAVVDLGFWSSSPGCRIERKGASAKITASPGRYIITFEGYQIDWENRRTIPISVTQEFTVVKGGGGGQPQPPDTGQPDKPAPGQPNPGQPNVEGVRRASEAAVKKLNDPVTANRLYDAISAINPSGDLNAIHKAYRNAVSNVLLTRERPQQSIAWNIWRVAVSDAIQDLPQPVTKETYVAAIRAAVEPLETAILEALKRRVSSYRRPSTKRIGRARRPPSPATPYHAPTPPPAIANRSQPAVVVGSVAAYSIGPASPISPPLETYIPPPQILTMPFPARAPPAWQPVFRQLTTQPYCVGNT